MQKEIKAITLATLERERERESYSLVKEKIIHIKIRRG